MDTLTPLLPPPDQDHRRSRRAAGDRQRRTGGRRSRRVARQRRAARAQAWRRTARRAGLTAVVVLTLVAVGALGTALLRTSTTSGPAGGDGPAPVVTVERRTLLVVRLPGATSGTAVPAAGLTLLSSDPVGGASVVFIPSTSLVEVPGVGLDRLRLAQQYGGTELTVAAVENALGIDVTGGLAIDDRTLGAVLDVAADQEVVLDRRLVERDDRGNATVRFDAGPQRLAGPRLAELWRFTERGEAELDTFARQQLVWQSLLEAVADGSARAQAVEALPGHADRALVEGLLADLADAAVDGDVAYQLLPVRPFGTADASLGASYQLQREEVAGLLDRLMPGAAPAGAGSAVPIQVLNGVGVPGLGQRVDRALEGVGVRIVRTDNARSFEERETRIVIYDERPEMVALAHRVQAALGVGTILVSRQPQSVVDLTIVVGHDFTATGSGPAPGV